MDALWKDTPYVKEKFLKELPKRPEGFRQLAKKPTKVAWAVSHWGTISKRENYVQELKKHIEVIIMDEWNVNLKDIIS